MVTVTRRRRFILFTDGSGWSYDVPLDQLKDERGGRHWLDHLEPKRWFTPDVRAKFLALVGIEVES